VKQYEGDAKKDGVEKLVSASEGKTGEIGTLKKKLEQKDRDLENLKKQSEGLTREYRELSDKYAEATGAESTPKKDR
jgi:B-cell receptor-associated protein 31